MKLIYQSIALLIIMTVLTGIFYPLLITGIAQLAFPKQANGSLIVKDGKIIGSELIGQSFTNDIYFQGRPSASDYDSTNSGGFNLGPCSSNLILAVSNRIAEIRKINKLDDTAKIPPDMALASASGLDPDISIENAEIQAKRIAGKRNISIEKIKKIIEDNKENGKYGFWGIEKVNVLKLNMALDLLKGE